MATEKGRATGRVIVADYDRTLRYLSIATVWVVNADAATSAADGRP